MKCGQTRCKNDVTLQAGDRQLGRQVGGLLAAHADLRVRLGPAFLALYTIYTALVTVNSFLAYAACSMAWPLVESSLFPATAVTCALLLGYISWLAQEAGDAVQNLLVPLRS